METQFLHSSSSMEQNRAELWEYLLVGYPCGDVYDRIIEVKQSFRDTYKQKIAVNMKPHITVANFLAKESMEETLIRWIHRICSQQKSFEVSLNNYSGFPPHTIYVRIQDPEPFRQLAVQLKVINQYVQANGCPEARLIFRPHLTIARSLDSDVYNKAMPDYSQKIFHETFQLKELVLLKRSNQFDQCKQVNVFRFYPPDTHRHAEVA